MHDQSSGVSNAAWSYNQTQLGSILGRLNVGIAQTDPHGHFIVVNEEYCRITGYSANELLGMNLMQITYPEDLERNLPLFERCVRLHEPFVIEKRYVHKSGRPVWVRNSVSFASDANEAQVLTAVCIDITAEKVREATLQKAEERYQHFIQRTTEGIWCFEAEKPLPVDLPVDEQIDYFFSHVYLSECNDAMARMYGVQKAELLVGARVGDFFPRDERTTQYFRAFIESGYLLTDAESLEMTQHAGPRYFSNNLLGIVENGLLYRCWGTQRDITERRQMEEKLRQSEQLLLADIEERKILMNNLEKLVAERTADLQVSNDSLKQFAHVASHDLKEPVRKISLFASRLYSEAQPLLPEATASLIKKIEASAHRMRHMIDGVLEFSSMNVTQQSLVNVDLHHIITGIVSDLEMAIEEKQATIRFSPLPVVQGEPTLIHQLFYNLMNNALKFASPGRPPVITLHASAASSFVAIEVIDNGIGINAEHTEEIFKPFIRLHSKDKYEGTGLGLPMCRNIVTRLGGDIHVRSTPEEGSTFIVHLLPGAGVAP